MWVGCKRWGIGSVRGRLGEGPWTHFVPGRRVETCHLSLPPFSRSTYNEYTQFVQLMLRCARYTVPHDWYLECKRRRDVTSKVGLRF